MNMKKHVVGTAVAVLMMTGMAYEWTLSALDGTSNGGGLEVTVTNEQAVDGVVCLDTKFFLPLPPDRIVVDVQQRRESLDALLTAYEGR